MRSALVVVSSILLGCSGASVVADAGMSDAAPAAPDGGIVRTRRPVGRLRAEGTEIVDAEGTAVSLRGVNLGSWLFVETWMSLFDYPAHGRIVVEGEREGIGEAVRAAVIAAGERSDADADRAAYYDRIGGLLPASVDAAAWSRVRAAALACADVADDSDAPLRAALEGRFGADGRDRVLDAFWDAWITEADIAAIASRGANLVRVPTGYRAYLEGADAEQLALGPLRYRERTFERLEALLDWCDAHGVRAILDLQESPGGHNDYSGPARLYDDPAMQEATITLWREIASRFRDRDTIAAYSLLAEPFSAPSDEAMISMYDRLHDALRADGDEHLLVIHDGFRGMDTLPIASEIGWTNVIYSTHLFEWGAESIEDYEGILVLYRALFGRAQRRQRVPYFIGSFSTMADAAWAYESYDLMTTLFAENGWSWSMWAWKRIDDPMEQDLFARSTSWGVLRDIDSSATSFHRMDVCHDDETTLIAAAAQLGSAGVLPNPELDARFRAATAR